MTKKELEFLTAWVHDQADTENMFDAKALRLFKKLLKLAGY